MSDRIMAYWRAIQDSRLYRSARLILAVIGLVATIQFGWTLFNWLTPEYLVVGHVDPTTNEIVREVRLRWPYGRDCVNLLPQEHNLYDGADGINWAFIMGDDVLYGGWEPDGNVGRITARSADGTLTAYTFTRFPAAGASDFEEMQLCRFASSVSGAS